MSSRVDAILAEVAANNERMEDLKESQDFHLEQMHNNQEFEKKQRQKVSDISATLKMLEDTREKVLEDYKIAVQQIKQDAEEAAKSGCCLTRLQISFSMKQKLKKVNKDADAALWANKLAWRKAFWGGGFDGKFASAKQYQKHAKIEEEKMNQIQGQMDACEAKIKTLEIQLEQALSAAAAGKKTTKVNKKTK